MPTQTLFRLSPGIVSGTWQHDAPANTATLTLNFAGIAEPVELTLAGDVPAALRGCTKSMWGYRELPEDQQPNVAGEASESVLAFVEGLRANAVGTIAAAKLDDDRGVSLAWRAGLDAIVGDGEPGAIAGVRFCVVNPRAV